MALRTTILTAYRDYYLARVVKGDARQKLTFPERIDSNVAEMKSEAATMHLQGKFSNSGNGNGWEPLREVAISRR